MKYIAILIMVILPITLVAEEVKLPSSVDRVLTKHEKAIDKARTAYLKELSEITASTLKSLEKEQEKVVKSGKLELAMAVKAKIDEVKNVDPTAGFEKVSLFGEKEEKPKSLKGRSYIVEGNSPNGVSFSIPKNKIATLSINEDKWSANGSKGRESNFNGIDGLSHNGINKMAMIIVIDGNTSTAVNGMKLEQGDYTIKCNDDTYNNNTGSIKIFLE